MISISESTSLIGVSLTIVGILLSAGWVSQSWLNKKFADASLAFNDKIDKLEDIIVRKMEYHEQHDDSRFAELRKLGEIRFNELKNDVWDIRIRNAAKDGHVLPKKVPLKDE